MDVESMYTNTGHDEAISEICSAIKQESSLRNNLNIKPPPEKCTQKY